MGWPHKYPSLRQNARVKPHLGRVIGSDAGHLTTRRRFGSHYSGPKRHRLSPLQEVNKRNPKRVIRPPKKIMKKKKSFSSLPFAPFSD
ncbi:hypothetical protein V6Z11_D12G072400 [Gossypium hirsutum]